MDEFLAKVIRVDTGEGSTYHVIDQDGTQGPACKVVIEHNKPTLILTPSASNRKWLRVDKADAAIATDGFFGLTYNSVGPIGPRTARIPNEKLVAYLDGADQEEYLAIIDRARIAMEAAKAQPVSEAEKARKRAENARVKYERLLAFVEANSVAEAEADSAAEEK